ncbi:hypothetical protein FOXB_09962 [Fusarium oxysporum f. sp. conglutinans Fo5176]|uniref:Uncharacterized protein n=1 Tax=Fusarium oxysporum (strain Fo5176) TaxID=660025 RepID=F9FU81_FUSOF|nr:hypothetical protein FOXB_09962 [Fusarium oxysporum f. sp. conglutinans Fo5176]
MAALAVCILLWLLSGLVFLLRGPAHHRRHPGTPTVSQTNIPRQCRRWRQTGSLFICGSQQTASRVGSDGLRPEFRRLASLRLNKTGRNDPTEGVNVKECCAMCRAHKDCCTVNSPTKEPELKLELGPEEILEFKE